MSKKVFGFVRAIHSRDPRHTAPPFIVEIYSPTSPPGTRTKRFHLEEVCDNRELVLVSLLRDALAHALPVQLGFDKKGQIDHVEIRTRTYFEEGKFKAITGRVKMISVNEFGMGKENWYVPNLAGVYISPKAGKARLMCLNLQMPDKQTKMAQLSLLRRAYEDGSDVTVSYQDIPVAKNVKEFPVNKVKLGKTLHLIVGVQLGTPPS